MFWHVGCDAATGVLFTKEVTLYMENTNMSVNFVIVLMMY